MSKNFRFLLEFQYFQDKKGLKMPDGIAAAVVTSVASFAGLMAGFIWNANQHRINEKNSFKREQIILRAALLAELESLLLIYKEEIEYSKTASFTWVSSYDFFNVYRQNISKLGFLSVIEVRLITFAFYRFKEHLGYIKRNASDTLDGSSVSRTDDNVPYKLDSNERRGWLLVDLEMIVKAAEEAKSAIAKKLESEQTT